MGGPNCDSCRSWAEDIYWSHFQFLRFAQFLRTGYDHHLPLPKTFSDNLKKKLPENVALRGPAGVLWNVGLTTRDDTLYFTHGWEQFLKDHSLKENDFLVFKYNGESLFDVLIFDGESFCEKATSYFVRKCGHTENGGGECLTKRKDRDDSAEEVNTPPNAGVQCAAPEKSGQGNSTRVPEVVPSETPDERIFHAGVESAPPEQVLDANGDTVPTAVPLRATDKRVRKLFSAVKLVQTKRRGRGRPSKLSNAGQGVVDWVTDSEPASVGQSGTYDIYTSNRRPVTENEKNNACRLAQAACTNKSLLIIMRPTHVYKRFYLSIPSKWMVEHFSPRSQDLVLRMGKAEWHVKYGFQRNRYTGGLTTGWKHFALENNLEEFDVCVFEPVGKVNDKVTIDVNIFRVVEDIASLSMAKPPGKRGRKRSISAIQI